MVDACRTGLLKKTNVQRDVVATVYWKITLYFPSDEPNTKRKLNTILEQVTQKVKNSNDYSKYFLYGTETNANKQIHPSKINRK
jgi:hypothetical protein